MKLIGEGNVVTHFLRDCELRSLSRYTLESYTHHLKVLVEMLQNVCKVTELEEVTVLHLRECLAYLVNTPTETKKLGGVSGTLAASSVRGHIRVWKAFFVWCYKEELITKNPADGRLSIPKMAKKITPTFTNEHIQKMLSSCDLSTDGGFRDYVILLVLLDTGMRLSEIGTLRLNDFQETYIKVMGKGRKEREIGLHPDVSKLLWKYIHKYRKPKNIDEPMLFVGVYGKGKGIPFSRNGVKVLLKRIKKATGITADAGVRFSAHTFRHTFSKMYMQQGGEVLSLSRELGHSSVSITEKYLGNFGSHEARKEHTSFSPIGSIDLNKGQNKKKKQK